MTSTLLTYRDARIEDLDRLVELDALCFPPGVRYPPSLMRRYAFNARSKSIVAADKVIQGFVVIRLLREGVAEIVTIDVDPAARRSGIGRELLRQTVKWAEEQKARMVALEVDEDNDQAVALYAKLGFEIAERYRDDHGKPRYVMTRALDARRWSPLP